MSAIRSTATEPTTTEADVLHADDQRFDAMWRGDWAALDAVPADDLTYVWDGLQDVYGLVNEPGWSVRCKPCVTAASFTLWHQSPPAK